MKRLLVLLILLLMVGVVLSFTAKPRVMSAGNLPTHELDIANGERLFHTSGCVSCHVSAEDESREPLLGGGLAMDSPYGVFHVPNISPDPDYGIGAWSTLDFVNAMKLGASPGGEHYYPAFPYTSYSRMSAEDLMDLKVYLDSLPSVRKQNLDHVLRFPWNIRAGIGLWKLLNLDERPVISGLEDNDQIARGQYLVEGPGHCGECHTSRNLDGGLNTRRWLAGAPSPDGDGSVPNITPSQNGLASWMQNDIVYYLESGFTPDFDTVGGSMVKVQKNMAKLTADDREAIAAYLLAIPALD